MDSKLKFVSLNCQGIGCAKKRRDLFHYLRLKKYDIMFLQDTHIKRSLVKFVGSEWGYHAYFSCYTSNSRGVAILINNSFEYKKLRVIEGERGNYVLVVVEMNKYLLASIYGPNEDNPDFYDNLTEKIIEANCDYIILGGDLNLVMDPLKDYENYKSVHNPNAREAVEALMQQLDLCDVWREQNPDTLRYTWRRRNPFIQSRLDYFLVSDNLTNAVENPDIVSSYKSDHSMVTFDLKLPQCKAKRNSFWKFNTSLLKDTVYVGNVNELINEIILEYATNISTLEELEAKPISEINLSVSDDIFLDFLLMKIRSNSITYAKAKKKKTNEEEDRLLMDIEILEKDTPNEENFIKITELKSQLQSIREQRMQGVLLRSRARWVAEGEKVTKYFCNLEKRHYISKTMSKLINREGKVLNEQKEVEKEVNDFYESLYEQTNVDDCEISDLTQELPTLSEDLASSLEGEITLFEASLQLKEMKNLKSPGSDGFQADFFKFFWCQLGGFVVRALNTSFRKGHLSTTQREGVITCIPKGDKDRQYIKNWRPISLLNVVYKIGSSCIAKRIKKALPSLINEDQTGFMANRYLGENLRLIYDTIAYLDEQNLPGLLVNVDFEKAFDSLDWNFMMKVLKAFGFKQDICNWIRTFYSEIKSTVVVNGQATKWFKVNRGCRQGDPISPYLFILCVEILACMVRQDENIKGITVDNEQHKLSQYADDTEFLLAGDKVSFETCFSLLDLFGSVSGLKLNHGKTSCIWLGSRKNSPLQYMTHLSLIWNPVKFKVLGVWLTNDLKDCVALNFNEKFEEAKRLFLQWMRRCITPLGRVAVLKSLILSKLIHLWILLPNPPQEYLKNIQKICFAFVWNEKNDKIARRTSCKSVKEGGLGIPNVDHLMQALKVTWIRKWMNSKHRWKNVALKCCPMLAHVEQVGPQIQCVSQNKFWTDVIHAYQNVSDKLQPTNKHELLAEPLLFNKNVKYNKTVLTNANWIGKGFFLVGHLFDEEGNLLSYNAFKTKFDVNIDFLKFYGCQKAVRMYTQKYDFNISDNRVSSKNVTIAKISSEKLNRETNWRKVFHWLHGIQDVNLKWFQGRIIHRIIGTNVMLKSMGVSTDDRCGLCGNDKDSIDHFLWKCHVAKTFWEQFTDNINEKVETQNGITLSESLILFGVENNVHIDKVLYLILIIAKQYLYKCKLDKCIPNITVFKRKMAFRYKIEEFNAKVAMSLPNFNAIWLPYKDFCLT
jgi:exonuclease III/uncharacterized protein (UPF0305 family)